MVPASILAQGDKVALEYLLESTSLGGFFEREEVRKAIAEDILLEQFKPFVFTSIFYDSDGLQSSWRATRPEAYTLAKRLCENDLSAYASLPPEPLTRRHRLRMSAYRKLDAWWCGNEIFTPHETLGAEPYFNLTLPGYEARPVKIGAVQSTLYNSDPKRDAVALELIQKVELLEPIERALFPLLPPDNTAAPQEWVELQAVLAAAEPFKLFDRSHKLPVFPKSVIVDPTAIPAGFIARFAIDAALWKNLYALGISPIISEPASGYLKAKARSIGALITQRDTLLEFLSRSIHFEKRA